MQILGTFVARVKQESALEIEAELLRRPLEVRELPSRDCSECEDDCQK